MPLSIPLTGRFVGAVVRLFCQRPYNGDDSAVLCSIGQAGDSVVASDCHSAVIIGNQEIDKYRSTNRKEALLAAAKAELYGEPTDLVNLPDAVTSAGEIRELPDIAKMVRGLLAGMEFKATLNVDMLSSICKLAKAAGVGAVDIYVPQNAEEVKAIGFKFDAPVDEDLASLFQEWNGPIRVEGVSMGRSFASAGKGPTDGESLETKEFFAKLAKCGSVTVLEVCNMMQCGKSRAAHLLELAEERGLVEEAGKGKYKVL